MASSRPPWLTTVVEDSRPPPRLFAWGLDNLESEHQAQLPSLQDTDNRIYILGLGNIGRLYASCLAQLDSPPPITLVVHKLELLSQWKALPGIEITRNGVTEKSKRFDIEWWSEEAPHRGVAREVGGGKGIRNLLITTKATAAFSEADRIRRYLDRQSVVAFAQNGMSKLWPPHGQDYIAARYADSEAPNFLHCITTHGVTSQGPFKSLHASPADAVVGPVLLNPQTATNVEYLVDTLTSAPNLNARRVSRADLWVLQLEKLVVNCVLNPLTAILRCKNGGLFVETDGPLVGAMDRILQQTSDVLQALVAHPSSTHILASSLGSDETEIQEAKAEVAERLSQPRLRENLYKVGDKVKENVSSMLQDVLANKPVEIRDINGWVVNMASFLDPELDVSTHQMLIDLVESRTVLTGNQLSKRLLAAK